MLSRTSLDFSNYTGDILALSLQILSLTQSGLNISTMAMDLSILNRHAASVVGLLYPSITVQNGVVDNKVFMADTGAPSMAPHSGSGAKSFSLGTENELDDCVDEVDNAKVGSPRVEKPLRKIMGYDSGFHSSDDDGSLPTSPDSQPCCPEFPTAETELHRETRELIGAFYRKHTGLSRSERCRHKAMKTMQKVVNELLLKHEIVFKGKLNHNATLWTLSLR